MRKILLLVTALFLSIGIYAQNSGTPNRLLIHEGNNTNGFILDRVDSLTFAKIEGEVAADVELISHDLDKITLAVTRTQACVGFKIAVEASIIIASMTDVQLASYIDKASNSVYTEDFSNAELTGIALQAGTDYSILTVGIDAYGVLCDVRKVDFTTEDPNIIGDPYVEAEAYNIGLYEFSVRFTPNQYVSKYYVIAGEKGLMQSQYEQFAPMFGFSNFGEMITMWSDEFTGRDSFTWTGQTPNATYEVFIQAYDAAGNMAPYQVYELSTLPLGGEGTAEVTITLGDYKLADWDGEMLPSQFITFTPNDQTSAYRLGVYLEREYKMYEAEIKEELCSENTMNVVNWFQHEEITTDYQIDPNTACVAVAAAKNINNEWGPITELRFTTPSAPTRSNSSTISVRKVNNIVNNKCQIPSFAKKGQVRLISK